METGYQCVFCARTIADDTKAVILTVEWLPTWLAQGQGHAQAFCAHSTCLQKGWKGVDPIDVNVLYGVREAGFDDIASLNLRVATLEDRAAIDAMLPGAFGATLSRAYGTDRLESLLPRLSYVDPALLTGGTYYVFSDLDGRIVACGGWTREAPGTGRVEEGVAHIRHFATAPDYTRRGLARRIFNRCVERARTVGIRELACDAILGSEAFYGAMNFSMTGQKTVDPAGAALPVFVLRKMI